MASPSKLVSVIFVGTVYLIGPRIVSARQGGIWIDPGWTCYTNTKPPRPVPCPVASPPPDDRQVRANWDPFGRTVREISAKFNLNFDGYTSRPSDDYTFGRCIDAVTGPVFDYHYNLGERYASLDATLKTESRDLASLRNNRGRLLSANAKIAKNTPVLARERRAGDAMRAAYDSMGALDQRIADSIFDWIAPFISQTEWHRLRADKDNRWTMWIDDRRERPVAKSHPGPARPVEYKSIAIPRFTYNPAWDLNTKLDAFQRIAASASGMKSRYDQEIASLDNVRGERRKLEAELLGLRYNLKTLDDAAALAEHKADVLKERLNEAIEYKMSVTKSAMAEAAVAYTHDYVQEKKVVPQIRRFVESISAKLGVPIDLSELGMKNVTGAFITSHLGVPVDRVAEYWRVRDAHKAALEGFQHMETPMSEAAAFLGGSLNANGRTIEQNLCAAFRQAAMDITQTSADITPAMQALTSRLGRAINCSR